MTRTAGARLLLDLARLTFVASVRAYRSGVAGRRVSRAGLRLASAFQRVSLRLLRRPSPRRRGPTVGGALDPASRRAPERFALKLVILLVFALAEAPWGFRRALGQLSLLTAVISGLLGAFGRERPAAPSLNHWDEAAMFLGPGLLIRGSG